MTKLCTTDIKHFQIIYNKILCGFRKVGIIHHASFKLLDLRQKAINKLWFVGSILTLLSKACDYQPHDLLLVKLQAYGFNEDSRQLLLS